MDIATANIKFEDNGGTVKNYEDKSYDDTNCDKKICKEKVYDVEL